MKPNSKTKIADESIVLNMRIFLTFHQIIHQDDMFWWNAAHSFPLHILYYQKFSFVWSAFTLSIMSSESPSGGYYTGVVLVKFTFVHMHGPCCWSLSFLYGSLFVFRQLLRTLNGRLWQASSIFWLQFERFRLAKKAYLQQPQR